MTGKELSVDNKEEHSSLDSVESSDDQLSNVMKDKQKLQFENKNDLTLEVQVEVGLQSADVLSVPLQATLQYEPHVEVEVATNVTPIALSSDSMSIRCGIILNVLSIENIENRMIIMLFRAEIVIICWHLYYMLDPFQTGTSHYILAFIAYAGIYSNAIITMSILFNYSLSTYSILFVPLFPFSSPLFCKVSSFLISK